MKTIIFQCKNVFISKIVVLEADLLITGLQRGEKNGYGTSIINESVVYISAGMCSESSS